MLAVRHNSWRRHSIILVVMTHKTNDFSVLESPQQKTLLNNSKCCVAVTFKEKTNMKQTVLASAALTFGEINIFAIQPTFKINMHHIYYKRNENK